MDIVARLAQSRKLQLGAVCILPPMNPDAPWDRAVDPTPLQPDAAPPPDAAPSDGDPVPEHVPPEGDIAPEAIPLDGAHSDLGAAVAAPPAAMRAYELPTARRVVASGLSLALEST